MPVLFFTWCILSVRYLDAQLLITELVKNPKDSNGAGVKIPPDLAANNLCAQFPRT